MKRTLLTSWFTVAFLASNAQTPILEAYVQAGLDNNLSLKQQGFVLQKNLLALQEAKTLFLPSVNFNTTYSTAQGGRTISIPVGDLMNPVYSTLNVLTKTNAFPQIENVNEQLVPKNFYDTRFKTQVPLINAEIRYGQAVRREQVSLQQTEIQLFKRELVKDIKVAYFNYLKAAEAVRVYDNALTLLRESERVNQSLITNGVANPTVQIRTRNEIARIQSEQEAAKQTRQNAEAYFNFLLNRELTATIQQDSSLAGRMANTWNMLEGKREELDKLQTVINLNQSTLRFNQAYKKPKIGAILDLGSQGNLTSVSSKNLFALFGLSIDLPVYQGGRNQLKIKQTEADLQALDTQLQQVKNQLDLQRMVAKNAFEAAQQIYKSKQGQVETAQRYYRDIFRRYKEGQANFIELLDAQTQITTAQLQQTLSLYDVWVRWVELERANAAYPLN
ncbi:MAG: TolC family protein [Spirosomataceae bacterium]